MSYAVPIGRHRAPSPSARRLSILAFQAGDPDLDAGVDVTPGVRTSLRRRLPGHLLNVVVLIGLLLFLGLAVGPHLVGYRTATMLTGSMEPGISPGDVVVTVERPAAELQVGDVISYQIPIEDHRVETHRVTEVDTTPAGAITIRTKGDNNAGVDPWTATIEGDTVWEVVAVVPKIGKGIQALRVPAFQHGIQWVSIVALVLLGLNLIWGSSSQDEESDR
ncbi:signal peptidase I [Nocardioides sp.]|uniref:signal peptidase I n=1 Tax=Nocardioides sp. TaxID=35761 RepID=UPI003566C8B5